MRVPACRQRRQTIAIIGLAVAFLFLSQSSTLAQTPDSSEAADLATALVSSVAASDFARAGSLLTPDAIVTFQNGDVTNGREETEKYVKGLFVGKEALIQTYSGAPTVNTVTTLDAQMRIVAGTSTDTFTLSSGGPLVLESRWTATIVQRDGQWKIAALHLSTNMLDNPFLEKMKTTSYLLGAFGFVMGLTLGIGVAMLLRKRSRSTGIVQ